MSKTPDIPRTLDGIFKPRSVAVIGASRRLGAIGRALFDKLLRADFNGPVYPVHPRAEYVGGVKAYPTLHEVPGPVDLAVIVVPRPEVFAAARQCGEKGVKGLIVITAGFKEIGPEGAAQEQELLAIVRRYGMRMIGPNCMGVICTDPGIRLDATFAGTYPERGNIAFASQSGALGVTILDYAASLNLGVSMFASIGNKADISGNDLLEYWRDDDSINVILMYLESFGRPSKFVQLAREVTRTKPIVVVKAGRTESGARAVSSHTGAITGSDAAFDALFAQCCVLRANSIEEMFDFAMGLANQPLPAGNRVAIITNAGGPAIMATDACENLGLRLASLSAATQARLREKLLPEASVRNPVDLLPAAGEQDFTFALEQVLREEEVDAALVIFVPPLVTGVFEVTRGIAQVAGSFNKPVVGCLMGMRGVATGFAELKRNRIPAFPFPESAVRCLAAMARYASWRRSPVTVAPRFPVKQVAVQEIVQQARSERREHLHDSEAFRVLQAYGIPAAGVAPCRDWEAVQQAALQLGYPVVLKLSSSEVLHKTEVKGVRLNLRTRDELAAAFLDLQAQVSALGLAKEQTRFLVQRMLTGGREVLFGIHAVPNFGAVLAFGLGGIYVEALKDIILRAVPLSVEDAQAMVQGIRGAAILQGVRGEAPVAFAQLSEVLLRLSQLAEDFPELAEMDINPFLAFPEAEKCAAVDVRMRIKLD